jgi:hypothetical protein
MPLTEDEIQNNITAYQNQVSEDDRAKQFEAANQLMAACDNNEQIARAALESFIRYKQGVFKDLPPK